MKRYTRETLTGSLSLMVSIFSLCVCTYVCGVCVCVCVCVCVFISVLSLSIVLVAEVTQPSLGVGYEIGRAFNMNKKILCLYRPQPGKRVITTTV